MNDQPVGLIDIIEPVKPVPAEGSDMIWVVLVVALVGMIVTGAAIWWRKVRPRRLAVKRLNRLRQNFDAGHLTGHEAIFLIAWELRRGLGLSRLAAEELPAMLQGNDRAVWPGFIQGLDTFRYQPDKTPDNSQLEAFFSQTETWLRRYCR